MLKKILNVLFIAGAMCLFSIQVSAQSKNSIEVKSPSEKIKVVFSLDENLQATYRVLYNNTPLIAPSKLGFDFKDLPPFRNNLEIAGSKKRSVNETWKLPWGEQIDVKNNYNEVKINLREKLELKRLVTIIFRVFDDGVGFRYEFPKQNNLNEVIILNEVTEFQLTADHEGWWSPGDWDSYEHLYHHTKISEINALAYKKNTLAQSHIVSNAVNLPFTIKTAQNIHMSFLEASIVDFPSMTLLVDTTTFTLKSDLVGSDRLQYKAKKTMPFNTPWRTILICEKAGDLIESKLILNLNEPNKLGDVSSWVNPSKYVGIWWEMHLNKSAWDLASGKHGATTANTKHYIDFAAKNNLDAVLVEGWNTGWEHWVGFPEREGVFDFVTPYKDYDIKEVISYGKSKGVALIIHNETSSAPRTYEKQLDTAYAMYNQLGIHTIKTGYVGPIIPVGEYHHGQWMVNHYQTVVEKAAKYKIAVNVHEPIIPSGLRRTYPNLISGEGLRGQEFNAWADDGGNPPDHLTIVPFTRMLAGPIDFTPGIFNLKLHPYKDKNRVNTTLAHQLALYVVIYSPVQMAADLPEAYEGHPAFQFIRDVGVDWKQTKVIDAAIGEFVIIAREEKKTGKWFVGSITNEQPRDVKISLSFLEPGKKYKAIIYSDGENAHWEKKPDDYKIEELSVNNKSSIDLNMKSGGGTAVSIQME